MTPRSAQHTCAILRLVDADWVNRWGILAEAISFLLIAPEIIGIERLRRVQDRLENLLHGASGQVDFRLAIPEDSVRYPFPVPRLNISNWGLWLGVASFVTGGISGLLAALLIGVPAAWSSEFWVLVGIPLAPLVSVSLVIFLGRFRQSSCLAAVLWHLFLLPILPLLWTIALGAAGLYLVLFTLARGAAKLLSGPDRLRVLVFGTGVILLIGGMAAQFGATF